MAKERRGKGEKVPGQSSTDNNNSNGDSNKNRQKISVEEQIQTAKNAVHKSIATVNAMHIQWRNSLMRMGYMVVLITIHQWQLPITSCLHDIKVREKDYFVFLFQWLFGPPDFAAYIFSLFG